MIKVVHDGIMCKECVSFSFYIEGWRHKCLQCANYDLCEIHFKYTTHDESHVFATLKQEAEFTPTQLLKPFLTKSPYKNPQQQQQVRSSSSSKPTESFSLFSPQQNSNDSFFNKSVVGQEKKTNSPPSTFGTPNSGFNFSPSSSSFGPTSTVGTSGQSKFLFSSQTSGFGLQPQPQQQQSKAFDFGMDVQ